MAKKICILMPSHWDSHVGGAEIQSKLIYQELNSERYELYFLGRKINPARRNGGIQVIDIRGKIPLHRYSILLDGHGLRRELDHIQPDLIYQRVGGVYTGLAAKYCQRNTCQMIWHISSDYDVLPFNFKFRKVMVFKYLEKKFLEYGIRHADLIIGQTNQQNRLLSANYNRNCDMIVPNFHPFPKEKIYKIKPIKVLWIANLKKIKNPEIFIKLANTIYGLVDAKFIMVGRPANNIWTKDLLRRIENSNIIYMGELPISEVNELLAKGHILVNTSIYEGFPNTFIQAWMRKVPVVSLNVDPDNVIKENGIGHHSKSIEQLIADVKILVENDVLRDQMGEKAQKYAFKYHSMDNVKKIAEMIASI